MATLVTGSALHAAVAGETFIRNGDASAVETVKYDLRLGSMVLKASFGLPKPIDEIEEKERWIEPGEVAFVLTQEELHLPPNMIAVLSPKRAITHRGVMVLGGFAIDPGYSGLLWFGLHNFASTRYPLRSGTKLIACMFYELDTDEAAKYSCVPMETVKDFPDDLIDLISHYKPIELKGIQDEITTIRTELLSLKTAFGDDKTWKDNFQKGLDEHNKQLGILIEGLREEKDARKTEDAGLKTEIGKLRDFFSIFRGWGFILALLATAALAGAAGYFVNRMTGH